MADKSTEKLVAALLEANAPVEIIAEARVSRYHDYKSPSITPMVDLVMRLQIAGLRDLAKRAMNGEFDGTPEEAKEWARGDEGRAAAARLGEPPVR